MSECAVSGFDLFIRPALSDARTGTFGAHVGPGGGIELHALPEGDVIQVLGAPGCGDLLSLLAGMTDGDVRTAGPGQWFIVGAKHHPVDTLTAMEERLEGRAALVDQSSGRVAIAISGPPVEQVLAKGTGIDLGPSAFQVGHSALTLLGHIAVHITRTGPTLFEILVMRSFAEAVWDDLISMALEFGVTCVRDYA